MERAQRVVDEAWENRAALKPAAAARELRDSIEFALAGLDDGSLRVAESAAARGHAPVAEEGRAALLPPGGQPADAGASTHYYDKVPGKFAGYSEADFLRGGFRVVRPRWRGAARSWRRTWC